MCTAGTPHNNKISYFTLWGSAKVKIYIWRHDVNGTDTLTLMGYLLLLSSEDHQQMMIMMMVSYLL